jgi:hypothetical protein
MPGHKAPPADDVAAGAMGETGLPTCLCCADSIAFDDAVVLVEHDGERLTSLAREPHLADDPRVLLAHARCAETLDVRRRRTAP